MVDPNLQRRIALPARGASGTDVTSQVTTDEPLIAPPPDPSGPRDISFAASLIEIEGTIWLYYSRNDRELKRATIRRTG